MQRRDGNAGLNLLTRNWKILRFDRLKLAAHAAKKGKFSLTAPLVASLKK